MASKNGHTTTVDVLLNRGAAPNIAGNVSVRSFFSLFEVESDAPFYFMC